MGIAFSLPHLRGKRLGEEHLLFLHCLIYAHQLVDNGIDGQACRRMDLQLLGDIAAVGDDRVGGDAQMVGYLLVGHSLHQRHDDITLTLAQRVVLTLVFHHAGDGAELHAPVCFRDAV